jgi:hypothetical protein
MIAWPNASVACPAPCYASAIAAVAAPLAIAYGVAHHGI